MQRLRTIIVLALMTTLAAACAPAAPVVELDDVEAPPAQVEAGAGTFRVLIADLYTHFLSDEDTQARYISEEATPALAMAELDGAIGLGAQAQRFVVATATELDRAASATTTAGDIVDVDIELRSTEVLGAHDGRTIVATTLLQRTVSQHGPITEQLVTYAVGWRGEELSSIEAVVGEAGSRGLDARTGLRSPQGAVGRFVELVVAHDYEAIEELSDGENTNTTTLDVLASVVDSAQGTETVTLPQENFGSEHVVYLLNAADMVIGRFEVELATPAVVVYFPTS